MSVVTIMFGLLATVTVVTWLGLHYATRIIAAANGEPEPRNNAPCDVIDQPGVYLTRCGEKKRILWIADGQAGDRFFTWNARSGRRLEHTVMSDDIVEKVEPNA
jgi:hypothetical protein